MTQSLLDEHYFNEVFGTHQTLEQDDIIEQEVGIFENLCKNKLEKLDLSPADIVSVNRFINTVDRINSRYPFVYLPYFLKDYLNGEHSVELIRKYNLWGYGSVQYLTENILKFIGKRVRRNYEDNPLEVNLENIGWGKNYIFLTKNAEIFSEELTDLLNHNILTSLILVHILNNSNTKISEIKNSIEKICETNEDKINLLQDENIKISFYDYLDKKSEDKINSIIEILYFKKYIKYESSDIITVYEKYSNISKLILDLLTEYPNGIPYENFRRKLLKQNTLLKIIPKMEIWEKVLDELKNQKKIVQIKAFWRYSPYRDQLFSYANFEQRAEELRKQVVSAGKTAFFGRKITPEQFISELEQLDKGTLDDKDDQVTRLAGMVLAGSILPQAPKEDLDEFDFTTDISNYNFTPTEIEAMNHLNITLTSNIIHIKVMLNQFVGLSTITRIKEKLPSGHQAVIFTFQEVSKSVKKTLPIDNSITILGKEAILTWSRLRPTIPCRVNSIAKLMYGPMRGKVAKVNSIDYETGIVSISQIPSYEETTVPIGLLSEIWISNCNVREYDDHAKHYEEFLKILAYYSEQNMFETGIFYDTVDSAEYFVSYPGMKPNRKTVELPNVVDTAIFVPKSGVSVGNFASSVTWTFRFKDIRTEITHSITASEDVTYSASNVNTDIRKHFQCSCFYWEGVTHSFKLCNHVITALNFMAKRMNSFNESWMDKKTNVISRLLYRFAILNKFSAIDNAAFSFPDEYFEMFLAYLDKIPCRDWNPNEDELILAKSIKQNLLNQDQNFEEFTKLFSKIDESTKEINKETLREVISTIEYEHESQKRRSRYNNSESTY